MAEERLRRSMRLTSRRRTWTTENSSTWFTTTAGTSGQCVRNAPDHTVLDMSDTTVTVLTTHQYPTSRSCLHTCSLENNEHMKKSAVLLSQLHQPFLCFSVLLVARAATSFLCVYTKFCASVGQCHPTL